MAKLEVPRKDLSSHTEEWVDSHGRVLQFCVMHETDPDETYSRQAQFIIGGYSLCRDCYEDLLGKLELNTEFIDGTPGIDISFSLPISALLDRMLIVKTQRLFKATKE